MKKLIPKYQTGKKTKVKEEPNTFIGMLTDVFGGDYKTGDQISSVISIHPVAGLATGLLDLGYDLNGIYHGTKTKNDAMMDIFSLLPGMKYARKFNLKKKSSDLMSYYYNELNRYLRKHAKQVNTLIGTGKAADLVDDSTHE